jgi:hypothetical protein
LSAENEARGASYYRSWIDKGALGKEVEFNASFQKSPQKQRIGSCNTPGLF